MSTRAEYLPVDGIMLMNLGAVLRITVTSTRAKFVDVFGESPLSLTRINTCIDQICMNENNNANLYYKRHMIEQSQTY